MGDEAADARLAHLKALDLMDTDAEPAFDAIVRAAADGADAPAAMISLIGADRQWFKAATGVDYRETPLSDSICAHAIQGEGTFVVADLSADARFRDMALVRAEGGLRFYAGAPLRLRDGTAIGTLCVVDPEARTGLSDDERQVLEALARRTVAAFELRRDLAAGELAGDAAALVAAAARHLAQASAALDLAGATAPLAHLEQVIAMVDGIAPQG